MRLSLPCPRPLAACLLALLWCAPAWPQDDMDDVLGGFDDLDTYEDVIELPAEDNDVFAQRRFDWQGALAAQASYNVIEHSSSTETDYGGLSKLRALGRLSLDAKITDSWRAHTELSGWYDGAYELREADYTDVVISAYQRDFQVQDAWLAGRIAGTDLKLGRQVVVWGFSDNLRVLDVLNPLDNLEPGLSDIEDLRRPVGLLRLDRFPGPWQLSAFVTPEQRFSRNPPFGSDFYSVVNAEGDATRFREVQPESFEDLDYAAAAIGRFSGWDLSLNVSRHWHDTPYLDASAFDSTDATATEEDFQQAAVLRYSRINFAGFGLQFTRGSWLFKQEAAVLDELELTTSGATEDPIPLLPALPIVGGLVPQGGQVIPMDARPVTRYDLLLGLEYFGLAQTNLSFDISARHIDDFAADLAASGYLEWRGETAFRATRDFLNAKLRVNLIGVLFNQDGEFWRDSGGALYRVDAAYDLGDGWEASGGFVSYTAGNQQPFNVSGDNDRVFGQFKWSF